MSLWGARKRIPGLKLKLVFVSIERRKTATHSISCNYFLSALIGSASSSTKVDRPLSSPVIILYNSLPYHFGESGLFFLKIIPGRVFNIR